MQYELDAKVRYYQVKTWEPPTEEKRFGRHMDYGVVATTAFEAMDVVAKNHPRARIDAVNDRGIVHHERAELGKNEGQAK